MITDENTQMFCEHPSFATRVSLPHCFNIRDTQLPQGPKSLRHTDIHLNVSSGIQIEDKKFGATISINLLDLFRMQTSGTKPINKKLKSILANCSGKTIPLRIRVI